MFHPVQQRLQPWQGVFVDQVDGLQAELLQAPVGDEADVFLDFLRRHARHRAHLEGEVDKGVFEADGLLADVGDVVANDLGEALAFGAEGVEELDDAFAVQAFVAHRPADNLAHALHLVEAREVHQHREAGEQLQPFGEAAEHRERAGDILIAVDPEAGEVIVLVAHFLVVEEGRILAFGHADGIEQVGIGRNVHGFHVAERGQHHLHLGRLEHAAVFVVVAILHLDIGLGEEAEDLGEEVALMLVQLLRPVAAILAQWHLFGHPVDLLLALPEIIGPRVFEGLVDAAGFEEGHGRYP